MKLMIIEAPGKLKKIQSILGNEYKVITTAGHIVKLKDDCYDNTGIDENLNFNFEFMPKTKFDKVSKKDIMNNINNYGKTADVIYVATDPDREGEGIAYHIYEHLTAANKKKAKRVTFNEISKPAIMEALEKPRELDMDYVNAYKARIALDKKIGYGLCKYLWKVQKGLKSAGRVQSVVLKLVVEREDEINNFVPKTYYSLTPTINGVELKHFETPNVGMFSNHEDVKFTFNTKQEAEAYVQKYLNDIYTLKEISDPKISRSYAEAPYKTSTLQKDIIKKFNIDSKKAEGILQNLYQKGFISYPRTDSTRMSEVFCKEAIEYVKQHFGDLLDTSMKFNSGNSAGAQDAHEAIRVVHLTDLYLDGEDELTNKVYKLIYDRTIIQFMKPVVVESSEFKFLNNNDIFACKDKKYLDLGYRNYLKDFKDNEILNFELNKQYMLDAGCELIKSTTTKPKSPFTQATLIAELEKLGIGRPSTYATSVQVNNDREYTEIVKKEVLQSTQMGRLAEKSLRDNWQHLINYTFTSEMEKQLDKIAEGKLDWKDYLQKEIKTFENDLKMLLGQVR